MWCLMRWGCFFVFAFRHHRHHLLVPVSPPRRRLFLCHWHFTLCQNIVSLGNGQLGFWLGLPSRVLSCILQGTFALRLRVFVFGRSCWQLSELPEVPEEVQELVRGAYQLDSVQNDCKQLLWAVFRFTHHCGLLATYHLNQHDSFVVYGGIAATHGH